MDEIGIHLLSSTLVTLNTFIYIYYYIALVTSMYNASLWRVANFESVRDNTTNISCACP